MTEFYIEYNPYLVECVFKKNGKELAESSKIASKSNQRLQVLLGESGNWQGLINEIAKSCDDDEVNIRFRGRRIDYDDLQYAINLYNGSVKFILDFEETRNDEDIAKGLDNILNEIKVKNIPEFSEKNTDGKDIYEAYEEAKNGIFEVSVIAIMSSGKSTLINSLLHTELLPSENRACTATICKILDNDEMDNYEATCYAADKNRVIYPRQEVTLDILKEYNRNKDVTYIDIEGSIPAIPSDKIRLCLRDTPGPNNSRNENHNRLTQSIIKGTNALVIYVMNTTQIGIKDDEQLLRNIANEMKRAGKQSRDRFIFVVNKCDALDEGKGETLDKLLEDIREYLEGFDITEPTLIPTSARLALIVRKNRKGENLSRSEKNTLSQVDDFVNTEELHYEKFATLTPTVKEKLQSKVEEYHADKDNWDLEALIHTGVPVLEATIAEYIEKYAYPMKVKDAIEDILSILDEKDMRGKFKRSIAENEEKLSIVRKQITEARKKHNESKNIYEDYKEKINTFKIDTFGEEEALFDVENELEQMVREYDGETNIDKRDADYIISEFQGRLENYQRNCESYLNREIENKIFKECQKMLEEYSYMANSILGNIRIEGFDFKKINKLKKIKISNIYEIKRRNENTRYRSETRVKDNPERKGFTGFFKFWKPKQISYTVDVEDGVDVNVRNVIVDIMSIFSASIKKNISDIFKQSYEQVEEYKKAFNENFDILDSEIAKILEELDFNTQKSEVVKEEVNKNKELANWFSEMESKIKQLLKF